ncbi:hypothetical protein GE061_009824 [Apolygus lucorum]|uniref:Uncharacterized protein n=1 Tax=Apolygus lucorum TaxID=248454 RepID=A0A6A4KHF5_APOLU|nr:hypothetical protein GE061_009824 [Apolygus lucorum]
MGDEQEDDGEGNERMRRRRSMQKKRLMRVSTRLHESLKEPTKLEQRYNGNIGLWVQKLQRDSGKSKTPDKRPPSCKGQNDDEAYGEETDKILETLHNLKRWLKRMWRLGQCYTQYCYPTLRTVEYYRKAKENQKRRRRFLDRKSKRNSKKTENLGGADAAGGCKPVAFQHDSAIESETSTNANVESESRSDLQESNEQPQDAYNDNEMLVPLKLALNERRDDSFLSWTEYITKQFNDITRALSFYSSNVEDSFQITMFFKWMCYLFLPAVLIVGMHYVLLKRKYKSLSGKLKRIKDENNVLVKESNKLESMLISTEQLTMSMSTKESRAQAVADFTRLSESLMHSKKEINQMKTERAALLEELKMARRRRDEAQKKYSSLTHGMVHRGNRIET